jgi:methylenetetrahydrofolate dehydrogenase (NADP+)/methenyltetrahydrofolate cyclohydrolase
VAVAHPHRQPGCGTLATSWGAADIRLIHAEHVKPGAVVVDVGTTRLDSGLVGDVAFDEVIAVAAGVTPVPGGVGPMTIAGLLWNAVVLAESAHS